MSIVTPQALRTLTVRIGPMLRLPSRRFMTWWLATFTGTIAVISITLQLVASLSIGAGL